MKRVGLGLFLLFCAVTKGDVHDCLERCKQSYTACMTPAGASFSVCWQSYMFCQDACLPLKPIRFGDPVIAAHWMDLYSGSQVVKTIDGYLATGDVYQIKAVSGRWARLSHLNKEVPGWARILGLRLACTEGEIYGYSMAGDPRCVERNRR